MAAPSVSPHAQALLHAAGWHPERRVPLQAALPEGHPAIEALAQYKGLTIGKDGSGEECAASSIAFAELSGDDTAVGLWKNILRDELAGIAVLHSGYGVLFMDGRGRCFGGNIVDDEFEFLGDTLFEAVDRLLVGRRGKPMLRPDQEFTVFYGEEIDKAAPNLYKY